MTDNFNGLTHEKAERLAMLAEEAGEVIQIVGKILRHGYSNYNPHDSSAGTNRDMLEKEATDFLGVYVAMIRAGDIRSPGGVEEAASKAWRRKLKWTHHQKIPDDDEAA